MKMEEYIQALTRHVLAQAPNYGDGDSLLTMLYETYSDSVNVNEYLSQVLANI